MEKVVRVACLVGNGRHKYRLTLITHFSAALSLSLPWVTKAMLQSTQRAKPSFTNSSAMLPAYTHMKYKHANVLSSPTTSCTYMKIQYIYLLRPVPNPKARFYLHRAQQGVFPPLFITKVLLRWLLVHPKKFNEAMLELSALHVGGSKSPSHTHGLPRLSVSLALLLFPLQNFWAR